MLFLIPLLLIDFIYRIYRYFFPAPDIDPRGKSVLITGCDSGFGRALALDLDKQGFQIFAGVFNESNAKSLEEALSSSATVFRLDITDQNDIDRAYEFIREKTNSLHALVNNAGISTSGFIDWVTMESMRQIMEVNFFGQVAITKKFLPLLISKRQSRVVNLCSVAGFITAPIKGAYSASKHAFEAFSDCLRREMAPWELKVSIIEPGPMRTPIIQGHDKFMQTFWDNLSSEVRERWGEDYFRAQVKKLSDNFLYRNAEDPQKVVDALKHAVQNSAPETRYRPGWQSKFIFLPMSMMPTWVVDLVLQRGLSAGIDPAAVRQ